MHLLTFYVPKSHCEEVKGALFARGAGRLGGYDSCSWEVEGTGQFRPLPGSSPYIGTELRLERLAEMRVEMMCSDEVIAQVVDELLRVHPYEVPAYTVVEVRLPVSRSRLETRPPHAT